MRIGVLEWASCGGAIDLETLPESIRREGWAMCRALIESVRMGGHAPVACLMPDLPRETVWSNVRSVDVSKNIHAQWRDAYCDCDLTIVVAPESDGELLQLEAWCESNGMRTTNSDAEFIRSAGDKWLTAQCLMRAGASHPWTCLLADWRVDDARRIGADRWVVKARDGAGCDGMQLLTTEELARVQTQSASGDRWIVQPWISGRALSRSAVVDAQGIYHWLPVVEQHLSVGTTVSYQGGSVLAEHRLTDAQLRQLSQAMSALPADQKVG